MKTRFTDRIDETKNESLDCIYDVVSEMLVTYIDAIPGGLTDSEDDEYAEFLQWGVERIKTIVTMELINKINAMD